jgi:uncharacterized phage protein (TIGR01671 family)
MDSNFDRYTFRGKKSEGALSTWIYGAYSPETNELYTKEFHRWLKVNPKTVGQCTGLVDANGTAIFEGDILRHNVVERIYIVEWVDSKKCGFDFISVKYGSSEYWTAKVAGRMKRIGNIHDNPELMEARAK